MTKKRREPETVPPIVAGGMRYEAPLSGALYGYAQDGGIVIARDAASNELAWTQRIYTCEYDDDMEDDKQDVFISKIMISDDQAALLIENEHGAQFRLNFSDRTVDTISKN